MTWIRGGWPLLAVAMLTGCGGSGEDQSAEARIRSKAADANVVIVLLDATSAHHMGCYGYHRDTTPHLDRVASESAVFDRAYAQASGTMLSVFSFFTSRYPVFETHSFRPWRDVKTIPQDLPTLAERLAPEFEHRLGYTSNLWMKRKLGHDRGFTEYWELWKPPAALAGDFDDDARAVSLVTDWMRDHRDDRFLAYVHLMKPHAPYDPPEPFFSRWAEREIDPRVGTHEYIQSLKRKRPDEATVRDIVALYDANLAYADHLLGEMIAELERAGIWERTVFVLMADHGQGLYELGKAHGHGGTICESTIRVPLLMRIPGVPGQRVTAPVELVDLVPTLLDLTGRPVPADSLAGRSLLPLLGGTPFPDGDLRLVHSRTNHRNPPIYSLSSGRFKLLTTVEERRGGRIRHSLHDLVADPSETVNLFRDEPRHPEGRALKKAMMAWLAGGGIRGTAAAGVDFEVFDPDEVKRLKSLGYTN